MRWRAGKWQLRSGADHAPSPSGEVSWVLVEHEPPHVHTREFRAFQELRQQLLLGRVVEAEKLMKKMIPPVTLHIHAYGYAMRTLKRTWFVMPGPPLPQKAGISVLCVKAVRTLLTSCAPASTAH